MLSAHRFKPNALRLLAKMTS